jgi:hypothetical protein
MGDADGVLGPGRRGMGDERCEEISSPSLLTYPTRHRTLDLSSIVLYVCIFPWQGEQPCHLYVRNTYVEAEAIRPFLRMSSDVFRARRGLHGHPGRDLETRGHTIGNHITLLSALSPLTGDCLAPRATNYVIRGAQGGAHSHRFFS